MSEETISYDAIRAAHARIAPYIHRTPVFTSSTLDEAAGARLFFKCENFQKTGAFKGSGVGYYYGSAYPTAMMLLVLQLPLGNLSR